ncbi:c-type cytochrome [Halobacteriovorax sp. XZX-3]|uniref:c-type cytochrome n=1 Tax=unclassified Halobacteriovorax TaxID=2639665 RepID=UPI001304AE27|nr:c-type cytochrome [Halobacteriovorax sp. DA5]
MNLFKITVVAALLSVSAYAGDAAKGKAIYKKVNCALCHNADGMGKAADVSKIAIVKGPRIAGLDAAYVAEQVTAIQSKKRKTKNTSMMWTKVRGLSAQDIKDVAAYVTTMSKDKYKGMNQK